MAALAALVLLASPATAQVRLDPSGGEAAADLAEVADPDAIRSARRAFVSYIHLSAIPFVREGGDRKWDVSTGPDFLLVVRDTQGNTIAETRLPVVEDVRTDDLPLPFKLGAQVSDFERAYALAVYDHDDWTSNELMFETQTFVAADAQREGRTHLDLLSRGGNVIGAVHFHFEGGEPSESATAEINW